MRSKGACNPAKEQLATGGRLCCPPLAPGRQQQLQTMQDNPETRAKLARLAHMHACIAAYTNTSAHAYTRTRVCVPWRKTPGKWHSRPPSCPVAAPCCGRPRSPWTPAASAKATPVVITARNQLACPHTSVPARPNTRSAPLRMNTHNIAPSRWRLSPPCWRACCSQTSPGLPHTLCTRRHRTQSPTHREQRRSKVRVRTASAPRVLRLSCSSRCMVIVHVYSCRAPLRRLALMPISAQQHRRGRT